MKQLFVIAMLMAVSACSTVAGLGKDITEVADWSKEKIIGVDLRPELRK
jgi:predicted small secreted protein